MDNLVWYLMLLLTLSGPNFYHTAFARIEQIGVIELLFIYLSVFGVCTIAWDVVEQCRHCE